MPTESRGLCGSWRSDAAALCFPGTGALPALPRALTHGAREAAGAGRALVAGVHGDRDLAVAGNSSVDGGGARAFVQQRAVLDADRIAVSAVAVPSLGHDDHAPDAIIIRGRAGRGGGGDDCPKCQNRSPEREITQVPLDLSHGSQSSVSGRLLPAASQRLVQQSDGV